MNRPGIPCAFSLLLFASLAAASGDGCDTWCGELPSAYFLAPMNDTRSNVGLMLEDLGQLAYAPKSLPFHYADFVGEASEAGETQPGESLLSPLAQELGLTQDALTQALGRQGGGFGRCQSDTANSVETFFKAIKSAGLPAADALTLANERLRFLGLCQNALSEYHPLQVSDKAKPFAQYLEAAAAFYTGQYDRAQPLFQSLATGSDGWLREISQYLLGRVGLNQAQTKFDDWSAPGPENIDRPSLDRAAAAFGDYLKAYPNGAYAASAKGLFRKLHWLGADHAALAADYQHWLEAGLGGADDRQMALDFINETESKQGPAGADLEGLWPAPVLAAAKILASWRPEAGDQIKQPVGKDVASAHAAAFSAAKLTGIDAYLQLAHGYWVDKDYAGVIQATATDQAAEKTSNQVFSRLVLRGLALLATEKSPEAESLWLDIIKTDRHPGHKRQAQWLLALSRAATGKLGSIYAQDTPVGEAEIHEFFVHLAPPTLLEQLLQRQDLSARVRSLAYFYLANGHLRHRDFKAAAQLLAAHDPAGYALEQDKLAPLNWAGHNEDDYSCPTLKDLLVQLQKSPIAAHSLNCMGDFLRTQNWDGSPAVIADQEYADEGSHRWHDLVDYGLAPQGKAAGGFAGNASTSLDYYRDVIERPGKRGDKEVAYALHRATSCFASSGNNHCGNQDTPKETRAAWFKRLKSDFKNTSWAQDQKYYW